MDKKSIFEFGEDAPDFSTHDEHGREVSLSDFQGWKVVLYFYPKDSTPGCIRQASCFRDRFDDFRERNAIVLGVSPDGEDSHLKFKEKQRLPFTLLTDEDNKIAKTYGVWGEKVFMGKTHIGMTRSHFVIDEQGRLLDAKIKVGASDSAKLAIETLDKFKGGAQTR